MPAEQHSTAKRALGLVTGVAFGALLQRGRLHRYESILGQLLFRDGRVMKAMGTAVAVGGVLVHALAKRGLTKKEIKPVKIGGVVGGAIVFGAGLALLGYCPGTGVVAMGTGRRDALAGVAGMLLGAGAFVALYPKLVPLIEMGGDLGKVTLPGVTGTEPATWIGVVAAGTLAAATGVEAFGPHFHG